MTTKGFVTSFDQVMRLSMLHAKANQSAFHAGFSFYPDDSDNHGVVLTSMGADPLTIGHVRLLLESGERAYSEHRRLVVLVNDDEFLIRKKGYAFMPLAERMEIIAAVRGVDYVAPWSSPTQFVDEAIRQLRPRYFTKGGDRSSPAHIAPSELQACADVGCEILYGVGGFEKVQSSSSLVENYNNASQKTRRVSCSSGCQ